MGTMGPLEKSLASKLSSTFQPSHFELENESHSHSVPRNSETHFRAVIVSDKFLGVSRIQRQRLVLDVVQTEMSTGVHAFTMRCLTPDEWAKDPASTFVSPACHGGSKREKI